MKDWTVGSLADSFCRVVETLQNNPMGALVVVLLAACAVAAGWAWRR